MDDKEFLYQFENFLLPHKAFNHQSQIRIIWVNLKNYVFDHALIRVLHSIAGYLKYQKVAHSYHETMSCVWVHLVHQAMLPGDITFQTFIENNDYLLDQQLPFKYYSPALLESADAKTSWVEPDIKSLYQL